MADRSRHLHTSWLCPAWSRRDGAARRMERLVLPLSRVAIRHVEPRAQRACPAQPYCSALCFDITENGVDRLMWDHAPQKCHGLALGPLPAAEPRLYSF